MRALLASACLLVAAPVLGGCGLDPVPQNKIDKLPPEDGGLNGDLSLHRPGQPCVLCHDQYGGAEPELAIGGTVYRQNTTTLQISPVEGVKVFVYDSSGDVRFACTNSVGNFYIEQVNWTEVSFPLSAQVGNRFMRSLVGRDRSCASCHRLATQSRVEADNSVDPSTGASRDSAGAILVEPLDLAEAQRCGPNPAAAAVVSAAQAASAGATGSGGGAAAGSGGAGATSGAGGSTAGVGGAGGGN